MSGAILLAGGLYYESMRFDRNGLLETTPIEQQVELMKVATKLPSKISEYTTLKDVTAEKNAVCYHFEITGPTKPENFDGNQMKKDFLAERGCKSGEVFLKQGINVEIEYVYLNNKTVEFTVTPGDCLIIPSARYRNR